MTIFLLILSVTIGTLLGKYFGGHQKFVKNLLIVSAGFLIAICLNEILPQVYHSDNHHIGFWVIGGVLLQMLLENFTKGFEHGHFHHHSEKEILPIGLIIGLFVHAFIEGIPLANEKETFSPFLQGIIIHNLPISFILGAFLFKNKRFSTYSWIVISMFALASPIGMFLGQYLEKDLHPYFLAIVGGIFLHISSVIIFESNKNHNVDWQKIFLVVIGIALAMSAHMFHSH